MYSVTFHHRESLVFATPLPPLLLSLLSSPTRADDNTTCSLSSRLFEVILGSVEVRQQWVRRVEIKQYLITTLLLERSEQRDDVLYGSGFVEVEGAALSCGDG